MSPSPARPTTSSTSAATRSPWSRCRACSRSGSEPRSPRLPCWTIPRSRPSPGIWPTGPRAASRFRHRPEGRPSRAGGANDCGGAGRPATNDEREASMPEAMTGAEVAVIGLASRFPGAATVDEFWTMVRDGVEGISFFSRTELKDEGIPDAVLSDPGYVPAKGYLPGTDLFDAAFFGYSPREAAFIDPQQRLFLECAWDALENAGVDPETAGAAIGVYGGGRRAGTSLVSLAAPAP